MNELFHNIYDFHETVFNVKISIKVHILILSRKIFFLKLVYHRISCSRGFLSVLRKILRRKCIRVICRNWNIFVQCFGTNSIFYSTFKVNWSDSDAYRDFLRTYFRVRALSQLISYGPHNPPLPSQFGSRFHERCAMWWIEWKISFPIYIFRVIVKIQRQLGRFERVQKWP